MKRSVTTVVVVLTLLGIAGCAITSTGSSESSDGRYTFDVTFFCDGVIGVRDGFEVVVSTETEHSSIRFTTEDDQGEKKGEATRAITPAITARATQAAPSSAITSLITMRLYEGADAEEIAKIEIEDFEDCQEGDVPTIVVR